MKNMAFMCKAKDLRANLRYLWWSNQVLCAPPDVRVVLLNSRYGITGR